MNATKKSIVWRIALGGALLLGLDWLAIEQWPTTRRIVVSDQQVFFGTTNHIQVQVVSGQEALAQQTIASAWSILQRLHQQYHPKLPQSELRLLNEAVAANQPFVVSDELLQLLHRGQHYARISKGLFDPGIGELIELWGFALNSEKQQPLEQKQVSAYLQRRASILQLQLEGNVVTSRNPAVRLNFGGYLKGYALDLLAQHFRQHGIHHGLINLGGNVMALGDNFGQPWRVAIDNPRKAAGQPNQLAVVSLGDGEAVGSSGDYWRFFIWRGVRYHHLLNPFTGMPANQHQLVTVLVQQGERSGELSDILSKPLFVTDHLPQLAQEMQSQIPTVFTWFAVDNQGKIAYDNLLGSRMVPPEKAE